VAWATSPTLIVGSSPSATSITANSAGNHFGDRRGEGRLERTAVPPTEDCLKLSTLVIISLVIKVESSCSIAREEVSREVDKKGDSEAPQSDTVRVTLVNTEDDRS
jgi:hypothetical protein